jgi:hypothetical protein
LLGLHGERLAKSQLEAIARTETVNVAARPLCDAVKFLNERDPANELR